MTLHTFVIYVEDCPGVLNRVSSLFRRRGFNIESLSVGHSEKPGVSRMTIVVAADAGGAARLRAHLWKLVHIIRVEDISEHPAIVRELALIKLAADHESRAAVMQLAHVFHARVVDVGVESLVVEICAPEDKVSRLIDVLRPYGILETVRTGCVAMARGSAAPSVARLREVAAAQDGLSYSV